MTSKLADIPTPYPVPTPDPTWDSLVNLPDPRSAGCPRRVRQGQGSSRADLTI